MKKIFLLLVLVFSTFANENINKLILEIDRDLNFLNEEYLEKKKVQESLYKKRKGLFSQYQLLLKEKKEESLINKVRKNLFELILDYDNAQADFIALQIKIQELKKRREDLKKKVNGELAVSLFTVDLIEEGDVKEQDQLFYSSYIKNTNGLIIKDILLGEDVRRIQNEIFLSLNKFLISKDQETEFSFTPLSKNIEGYGEIKLVPFTITNE